MDTPPAILTLTMNPVVDESSDVPRVLPEKKLRCGPPEYHSGGGGVNVARAVRKLGGEAQALFVIGGAMGEFYRSLVEQEGTLHRTLPIRNQTRVNLIISETETGQQFRFGMPGPELDEGEWRGVLDLVAELEPFPNYLVASGSLPRGVPDRFYADLARLVAGRGGRLIVDAAGEPLRQALDAGVFAIKPNLQELKQLAGKELADDAEIIAEARRPIEAGHAEMVVVSLGRGGALFVAKDAQRWIRSPSVPLRSKVGAGDSMVAGIVQALADGKTGEEAAVFGVAAGAAAVMTPGTELCRREDAERLYESIQQSHRDAEHGPPSADEVE